VQSLLIISKTPTLRESEAVTLCKNAGISDFDISYVERGTGEEKKPKLSLGIDDVKTMQKTLYFKPFRGDIKAVIVKDAHLLTPEAQNALLKVLEEPPSHTLIILTTETEEAMLPTVISRCRVITLKEETIALSDTERNELKTLLSEIPKWGSGDVLKQAEKLAKNKDEAIIWLEKMILITRTTLISQIPPISPLSDSARTYLHLLKSLQTTHIVLKTTNVNLRLALENLLMI
jgi:hypothetical protein